MATTDAHITGSGLDPHSVTISGLVLEPVYGPGRPAESLLEYASSIADPGDFPYTRGLFPQGYCTRLWTMRQFAGFGTAHETNQRFKFLLEQGTTGLSTAFDFPTLQGYDSDHEFSQGEVGKVGVAVDTQKDMETLFTGIPLQDVSVSMTINGPAIILFCFYVVAAEKQGVSADRLRGTVQNDILKEFMAQHAWIYPPEPALELIVAKGFEKRREYRYQHMDDLVADLREARDRLDLLRAEDVSVTAALDLSLRALPEGARDFLLALAGHPGPEFDALAASALSGLEVPQARRLLAELYEHHLVAEPTRGRYRFHDLVRLFALACAERDEDPPMQERLTFKYQSAEVANRCVDLAKKVL